MFFSASVTVAVWCSFSWLRAISVSYSSTRGFTITEALRAVHVGFRLILQGDRREGRAVMVEEGGTLLHHDVHETCEAEDLVRLGRPRPPGDDHLMRPESSR